MNNKIKNTVVCVMDREIGEMHTNIKWIRKQLEGNGVDGVIKSVKKNSDFRVGYESRSKFIISLIGSGWVLAVLALLTMFFG